MSKSWNVAVFEKKFPEKFRFLVEKGCFHPDFDEILKIKRITLT